MSLTAAGHQEAINIHFVWSHYSNISLLYVGLRHHNLLLLTCL